MTDTISISHYTEHTIIFTAHLSPNTMKCYKKREKVMIVERMKEVSTCYIATVWAVHITQSRTCGLA
jgi:hypothetical protein